MFGKAKNRDYMALATTSTLSLEATRRLITDTATRLVGDENIHGTRANLAEEYIGTLLTRAEVFASTDAACASMDSGSVHIGKLVADSRHIVERNYGQPDDILPSFEEVLLHNQSREVVAYANLHMAAAFRERYEAIV
jgi:hypothetical protein